MKWRKFLDLVFIAAFVLVGVFGCSGSGTSGDIDYVDKVCYTVEGDFEPHGAICDDGLCYNGTNSGICDGAGNCIVAEQDTYTGECLVFLSSTEYDGDLGGIAGADQLCQDLADAQGLTGSFKAWLSDATTSAEQRLMHSMVPYVDYWGRRIADDWQELTGGTLQIKIFTDEKGFDYANSLGCTALGIGHGVGQVWTNTRLDGSESGGPNCMDWTDNRTSEQDGEGGLVGYYCFDTRAWTDPTIVTTSSCAATRSLYCFQQ